MSLDGGDALAGAAVMRTSKWMAVREEIEGSASATVTINENVAANAQAENGIKTARHLRSQVAFY